MSTLHPHAAEPAPRPDPVPVDATPAAQPAPPSDPVPAPPAPRVRGTRTGRVWVGVCAAALITVALIVFMVQNTGTVQVTFSG